MSVQCPPLEGVGGGNSPRRAKRSLASLSSLRSVATTLFLYGFRNKIF